MYTLYTAGDVFPCSVSVELVYSLVRTELRHILWHGSRNIERSSVSRMVAELLVLLHPWKRAWRLWRNVCDRLKKSWSRSDSRDKRKLLSKSMGSPVLTGERAVTVQSLVDTKAIGKPPTFSGDIDTNGQPEGLPWSQWSFVFPQLPWSVRSRRDPTVAAGGGKGGGPVRR